MLIKKIMEDAVKLLNLSAGEAGTEEGETAPKDDIALTDGEKKLLLKCVDFVADDIASDYFPLVREDEMTAKNGRLFFKDFPRAPTAVASVRKNGKRVKFHRRFDGLKLDGDGKVIVQYAFKPAEATEDGETEWADETVSERILAYGVAAEYCIAAGLDADAEMWDKRYRDALQRAVIKFSSGKSTPPRRGFA